jgi:hypothetical protein
MPGHLHGEQEAGLKIGCNARLARPQPLESGCGQAGVLQRRQKGL